MIVIETLHHVSITVIDLERAKRFYAGVLGLVEIPRPAFGFPGAWYRLGDRELHLIVHPPTLTLRGTTEIDSRDGHFAVQVRSHRETRAHLEAAGVAYDDRPRNRTDRPQIFVSDPDGNLIELNAERLD
jgi:catechol 2,3-dioxygenase-like lactoylglutathione lyase family enzyme